MLQAFGNMLTHLQSHATLLHLHAALQQELPAYCLTGVGAENAPVEGIALVDDPVHGTYGLLHWRGLVWPMAEHQVHILQVQSLQTGLRKHMQTRYGHDS